MCMVALISELLYVNIIYHLVQHTTALILFHCEVTSSCFIYVSCSDFTAYLRSIHSLSIEQIFYINMCVCGSVCMLACARLCKCIRLCACVRLCMSACV